MDITELRDFRACFVRLTSLYQGFSDHFLKIVD